MRVGLDRFQAEQPWEVPYEYLSDRQRAIRYQRYSWTFGELEPCDECEIEEEGD